MDELTRVIAVFICVDSKSIGLTVTGNGVSIETRSRPPNLPTRLTGNGVSIETRSRPPNLPTRLTCISRCKRGYYFWFALANTIRSRASRNADTYIVERCLSVSITDPFIYS